MHLPEQIEDRQQPRLGADEAALGQSIQPADRFLRRRRQIEAWFIRVIEIELAKPALIVFSPVIEIGDRGALEAVLSISLAQSKQIVLKRLSQISLSNIAHITVDKSPLQEARDQRRMLSTEQPPCRMPAAK